MSQRRRRFRIGRTLASTVLLLIGMVLALEGILYLWADDTLFNADHFAAMSVQAANEPPVRTEISRILVDQAVAAKPDLLTVRPLLETVIETVITTPVFRHLLTLAVADLYRAVLSSDQHSYAVDLSNALTVAIGRLKIVSPELADQVPAGVHAGLIELGQGRLATELMRNLADLRTLMLSLGVAGGIMLAAAVVIAPDRRAALTSIGVSCTTGALLLFIALGVGRQVLVQTIKPESAGAAAGSVFDTFTGPLTLWLWILGIAGVLLATVSAAAVRARTPRAHAENLRRASRWVSSSTWGRLAALAVATAAGIGLLIAPELSLMLIVRAAGLLILYFAGVELLRLSGPASSPPQTRLTTAERVRTVRSSLVVRLAAIATLIVIVASGASAAWINRSDLLPKNLAAEEGPQGCNGFIELCDRPITQVAFAGTHNSQSAAAVKGFFFAEQVQDIPSQLDAGVRALLIKSHYGIQTPKGVLTDLSRETEEHRASLLANLGPDGEAAVERLQASFGQPAKDARSEPYLCHGFCELGAVSLDDTLRSIKQFLDKHPREVIIIFIGDYVTPGDTEAAFIRANLIDRVYVHRAGDQWPTLQEMIDVDRRVFVLSEHAADLSRPEWYHDGWEIFQDTPFVFKSETDLQSDTSCSENRGSASAPLFLINHWIPSQTPSPTVAERVNSYDFLLHRVQRCQALRRHFPNIIAVDFAEKGDLFRVVDTMNGVALPKPAADHSSGR